MMMFSMARPMGVEVSKVSWMETNSTRQRLRVSHSRPKSAMEREKRSRRYTTILPMSPRSTSAMSRRKAGRLVFLPE